MSKALEMKKEQVVEITEKFKNASSVVIVDYRGLKVDEANELRAKFKEAGCDYKVYKNTLVRRVASDLGYNQLNDETLVGPNAIAFGYEDPVAPARIIKDFMKDHPAIELKMGIVEGEFYDDAKIKELANVPSREVLIAKLLGSFKAPVSNFAYLLDAVAKQKEEAGE